MNNTQTTKQGAKAAPRRAQTYNVSKPADTDTLARELAQFIKEMKLSMPVNGREYVNVEGWQYAGSRLGIVPIVESVTNVSTADEVKYEAKVSLLDLKTGYTVGSGFSICSNREQGKKFYQEFAIMSMAQTRAIGKAYRNILAWIIRAAGYEPTPAEEMGYDAGASPNGAAARVTPAAAAEPETSAEVVATTAPAAAPMQVSKPRALTAAEAVAAKNEADRMAGVVYLTESQQQLIMSLLNHPAVPRAKKTSMLLSINRLTPERAEVAIDRICKEITDANGELPANLPQQRAAIAAEVAALPRPDLERQAAISELRQFAERNAEQLGRPEVDRLITICESPQLSTEQILQEKQAAVLYLAEAPAA